MRTAAEPRRRGGRRRDQREWRQLRGIGSRQNNGPSRAGRSIRQKCGVSVLQQAVVMLVRMRIAGIWHGECTGGSVAFRHGQVRARAQQAGAVSSASAGPSKCAC